MRNRAGDRFLVPSVLMRGFSGNVTDEAMFEESRLTMGARVTAYSSMQFSSIVKIQFERSTTFGLAILILFLVIGLVLFCYKDRVPLALYRIKLSPRARLALLDYKRGKPKTAFELFIEHLPMFASNQHKPMRRQLIRALSRADVADQIDARFDAGRGEKDFVDRNDVRLLIDCLQLTVRMRLLDQDSWETLVTPEVVDADLYWLFGYWDDIFPGDVGRNEFRELFMLLLTWMLGRTMLRNVFWRRLGSACGLFTHLNTQRPYIEATFLVRIGANGERTKLLDFTIGGHHELDPGGSVGIAVEKNVREFQVRKEEYVERDAMRPQRAGKYENADSN